MLNFEQACQALAPGSTVLLRVDLNLSRDSQGEWILNERFYRVIPVVKQLLAMRFAVVLVSHLGRPRAGVWEEKFSLASLCIQLEKLLARPVTFLSAWPYQETYLAAGTVALAENTRFLKGEKENDVSLAKKMVENIDLVVMEAFSCSHRSHASTVGILSSAQSVLGPGHLSELRGVEKFLRSSSPRTAFIGGKKISTKLPLLMKLLQTVDTICFGGGIANTLLHAKGFSLGTSWVEYSCLAEVDRFCQLAKERNVELVLPHDVLVSDDLTTFQKKRSVDIDSVLPHECIVDVGPGSMKLFEQLVMRSKSVYWNGPLGIYEFRSGLIATARLASLLSDCQAYTLVGGGDTLSALAMLGGGEFSHLSTGGGAFLHYLANGSTPVLNLMRELELAV